MRFGKHQAFLALLCLAGCGAAGDDLTGVWPPGKFGPFEVGFRQIEFSDEARGRLLSTAIWYPASLPGDAVPVKYLEILEGQAAADAPPNRSLAPYPLVLFSHGNQGISVQSFSLCEHLASQGMVVAAPNHPGNTLLENPSDEEVARVAIERPVDIVFVMEQLFALSGDENDVFFGLVDPERVGISGHSFGGYTTLVLAGAQANRDDALLRCQTTRPDDVMCPYAEYWPAGYVQVRPAGASILRAAVALAPGGYGAFGDSGLSGVDLPVLLAGGDLDEFTAADLRPIYQAIGPPRARLEIAGAGHLSFSDVCRANLPVPELQELCDPEKFLDPDRVFAITNAYTTAFFRLYLCGETKLEQILNGLAEDFPEVTFEAQWR